MDMHLEHELQTRANNTLGEMVKAIRENTRVLRKILDSLDNNIVEALTVLREQLGAIEAELANIRDNSDKLDKPKFIRTRG